MTDAARTRVEPAPTPEEAAAIVAALEVLRGEGAEFPARSRWRLAGLLGHPVPPGTRTAGSLWPHSGWGGGL